MTRTLSRAGIILALLAPCFALAAYNDVTLDTTVVLSVNSIEVDVTGSTASIASITINPTNFTIDLEPSSTITLTAPNRNILSPVVSAPITATETCTDSVSSLVLTSSAHTTTVTIAPQSTLCTTSSTSSGGGGGGGVPSLIGVTNSGGGGPPALTVTTPTPTPATPVSGLSVTQGEAVLSLLSSFDADAVTIASVRAALYGQASPGTATPTVFSRDLEVGMTGDDVKALQVYLNTHGYQVAASGPGSPGNETTKFGGATRAALIKLQKANNITPAAGYFGPKTRAVVK